MPISRPARTVTGSSTGVQTISLYTSSDFEASAAVKASAGVLFGFAAYNKGASAGYIFVFDATSVPADGAIPSSTKHILPIAAAGDKGYGVSEGPIAFDTGIVIALSSTDATFTKAGADAFFMVEYK